MSKTSLRVVIITVFVAIGLFIVLLSTARSQIQVAPSYLPIGVASSGATSMAWFHHPATGTVVACQASSGSAATLSSIQCLTAKLP